MSDERNRDAHNVLEVAARLGIGRDAAYLGCRDGTIPSIRIGNRIVVPKAAFERLLACGRTSGNEAS